MAIKKGWMHKKNGDISFGLGMLWGAAGGAIGSYFSSPFFMVSLNDFLEREKIAIKVLNYRLSLLSYNCLIIFCIITLIYVYR